MASFSQYNKPYQKVFPNGQIFFGPFFHAYCQWVNSGANST